MVKKEIKFPGLTIFGRALLLMICELTANAVCWIVAGILFGKTKETRPILSLALLAWTLGLRHALDADHIRCICFLLGAKFLVAHEPRSAIDNATRGLIGHGQLPVTCGLFFSLGHSTIVVIVTVAIAISSDVYNKINGVGEVGGIVGAAVSGTFLFLIGLANSIVLWRIIRKRRQTKNFEKCRERGESTPEEVKHNPKENHMLMMRILGPVVTFVDRPWKMYPVGVLFGFGFDTASSVALLAISAIAKRGADGSAIPSSEIIILPLLFTAGMTLVDSADSVLMLYSYANLSEWSWKILSPPSKEGHEILDDGRQDLGKIAADMEANSSHRPVSVREGDEKSIEQREIPTTLASEEKGREPSKVDQPLDSDDHEISAKISDTSAKTNVMSGLSIILTLMSILVAFSISLITIMGLIGEQCESCVAAAEADNGHGGGLAGRWWKGWAKANDQSGYIGVAIVGGFLFIVVVWYGVQYLKKRRERKSSTGGS